MSYYAVITGDIINSTKFDAFKRDKLLQKLDTFFRKYSAESENEMHLKIQFEIFRGDSFQGLLDSPAEALKLCILMRSYLKSQFDSELTLDARIAIGIGEIGYKSEKLSESDGEAFHNSGRLLDVMKKLPQQIGLQSPWPNLNNDINIGLVLLETIISKWTPLQADVVYLKLSGQTELQISKVLNIAQSSVNQRAKAAAWGAVEIFIKHFNEVTKANIS